MSDQRRLEISLLILRLSIGAFLGIWASLKFLRPEWMVNVFTNAYGLSWVTQDLAFIVGSLQALVVLAFVTGFARTLTYGFVTVMHATGVVASIPNLIEYTRYPNNLLWTSVVTLGALIALFIMRNSDNLLSLSARKKGAP